MEIQHTMDSPILLKLVPKTPLDIFENGIRAESFLNMGIPHRVEQNGTLVLNIDPNWRDFTDH